eukprot:superscaffoldBa00002243_g13632
MSLHASDSPGAPRAVEQRCRGKNFLSKCGCVDGGKRAVMGRRNRAAREGEEERRRFKPDLPERNPTAAALKFNMRRQTLSAAPSSAPPLPGTEERAGGPEISLKVNM